MKQRALLVAFAIVAGSMSATPSAMAQTGDVADAVRNDGYYLEDVDAGTAERVAEAVADLGDGAPALVDLASDVADPTALADDVLDSVPGIDTVIVLTPTQVGVSSELFTTAELDRALDASLDVFDADLADGLRAFAGALDAPTEVAEGGGGGGGSILLVILVVVVGGIGFLMWRNRRRSEAAMEERFDEAKEEIERQVAAVANDILELADHVSVADDPSLDRLFRDANATFSAVQDELPSAETLEALESLSDRLDEARWQLDSVEAHLEGRPPPDKPDKPPACFFDPAHGAGTVTATLRTAAGDRVVGVCRADAEKLARGETPSPRDINVGGRPVPAPRAPKSYGGGGLDWLDVFNVVVGGASAGYDLRRGRNRPRRRTTGGVAAGGRLGVPFPGLRSGRRTSTRRASSGRASSRRASTRRASPGRSRVTRSRSRGRTTRRRR